MINWVFMSFRLVLVHYLNINMSEVTLTNFVRLRVDTTFIVDHILSCILSNKLTT